MNVRKLQRISQNLANRDAFISSPKPFPNLTYRKEKTYSWSLRESECDEEDENSEIVSCNLTVYIRQEMGKGA